MEQTDSIALEYAGFWRRFAAILIDWIIVGIATSILIPFRAFPHFWDPNAYWFLFPLAALSNLASIVVTAAYYAVMWNWRGQTLGMMALNIKVLRANGANITLGYALLRYLGYIVCGITLGIGFLIIAFDARKQGLHDKIADTVVVKLPQAPPTATIPAAKPSAG